MSEQSRDEWAKELLTSTLALAWHASEPQARRVADAAAMEVEKLQEDRDALRAHVEEWRWAYEQFGADYPNAERLAWVNGRAPTTSHAELQARIRQELLDYISRHARKTLRECPIA